MILPGVGAAPVAMAQLARAGLVECIRGLTQPVLGICLGMQLLFERSEEGDTPLLGLVGGTCGAFDPGMGLTVPHMGWNRLLPQGEGGIRCSQASKMARMSISSTAMRRRFPPIRLPPAAMAWISLPLWRAAISWGRSSTPNVQAWSGHASLVIFWHCRLAGKADVT
ncbi:MAG: hypothetical protein CM15mP115_25190 [Alphaproteobacteria bacterium]|nr:MAG: hypothetical protein CM15mP115_25190 [Alphaproteobacteria bacterium]